MIFLFRLSNLFLAFCIFLLLFGLISLSDPKPAVGPDQTPLLIIPALYVLWRFRRPLKWIIGALIFVSVFFYTLMAGLLGKHPEPDVEEE